MDIFGTTLIGFEEELNYSKECMCKRNGVKKVSNYIQEEDMMTAKFSVMECEMMQRVGRCIAHLGEKKGK